MKLNYSLMALLLSSVGFISWADTAWAQREEPAPTITDHEPFARQVQVTPNIRIVEIFHYQGNLTVVSWDQPYILIEGNKRAFGNSVYEARQLIQTIQIKAFERVPDRLVLQYDGPEISWRTSREQTGIDYTAHIPRNLALDIFLQVGSVAVADFNNHVSIDHRAGDVTVEKINGKLQVRSTGGDVVIRAVQQTLRMDTQECTLDVRDISGDTSIRHKLGDIRLNNINGKLILNTMRCNINLDYVKGMLDIDHRNGDITCDRFYDAVRMYVYKGNVRLTPQVPLSQNYFVAVDRGDVILRVPEESSMLAEIEVENGRIHSDYYMPIWADKNLSYTKGAVNGGQNLVNLSVSTGSASLLKALPGEYTTMPPAAGESVFHPLPNTSPNWEPGDSSTPEPMEPLQPAPPLNEGEEIQPVQLP